MKLEELHIDQELMIKNINLLEKRAQLKLKELVKEKGSLILKLNKFHIMIEIMLCTLHMVHMLIQDMH